MRLTDQESINTMSAELDIISDNIARQVDLMKKGLAFNMQIDHFFDENSHFPEALMRKEVFEAMPGYKKLLETCKEKNVCLEMILDNAADAKGQPGGSVVAAFYKTYAQSTVFLNGQCTWTATPAATAPAKPRKPRPLSDPDDFGFID